MYDRALNSISVNIRPSWLGQTFFLRVLTFEHISNAYFVLINQVESLNLITRSGVWTHKDMHPFDFTLSPTGRRCHCVSRFNKSKESVMSCSWCKPQYMNDACYEFFSALLLKVLSSLLSSTSNISLNLSKYQLFPKPLTVLSFVKNSPLLTN